MPRALIYLRNSSDRQAKAGTVAAQRPDCRTLAARLGCEEVREFVEEGVSGAAPLEDRPAMRALLADARRGDAVVAFALDRLSRSDDEIDRAAVYGTLRRAGARVATVLDGEIDGDTMGGRILRSIREEIAAEERRKILARTAAGKQRAAQQGRKPQGATPYGLTYSRTAKTWGVDGVRAGAVRDLYARALAGATCAALAEHAQATGYPTPRGPRWTARMAWQLLTRPTYRGEWTFAGFAIAVPAIVDVATWQGVQGVLLAAGKRGLRRTQHVYLLDDGTGRCGECGGPVHVRWGGTGGQRSYYLCQAGCRVGWRRTDATDADAWQRIAAALRRTDIVARAVEDARAQAEDAATGEADAVGFEHRLTRLGQVEAAILARFRRGLVSETGLDREVATIARERTLIERSAEAARQAAAVARAGADASRALRDVALRLASALRGATPAERRDLVRALRPDVRMTRATVAISFRLRAPAADVIPIGVVGSTCSCRDDHCATDARSDNPLEIAVKA